MLNRTDADVGLSVQQTVRLKSIDNTRKGDNYSDVLPPKAAKRDSVSN